VIEFSSPLAFIDRKGNRHDEIMKAPAANANASVRSKPSRGREVSV
jgi:hypothetical protein